MRASCLGPFTDREGLFTGKTSKRIELVAAIGGGRRDRCILDGGAGRSGRKRLFSVRRILPLKCRAKRGGRFRAAFVLVEGE